IAGRGVAARADIYSLGVVLYRALTGSPVFRDVAVPALIHSHLNAKPDPMTRRAPGAGISQALDGVIQRCLAKRPEERFATMAQLGVALQAALEVPDDGRAPMPF